jgi:GNAT superfamily N-acetyltransferase
VTDTLVTPGAPAIHVWLPEDDPNRFLPLLRLALGPWPASRRTPEFWRWKHVENPFGPSLGVYRLTKPGDPASEIIGLRMLLRWSFDDGRVQAVRAVDTATHPAHRRRGVFSALTRTALDRLAAEGVHLVFNTPNPVSLAGYRHLGWRVLTRWPRYFRLRRPLAYWRHRLGIPLRVPGERSPWTACFGPEVQPWDRFVDANSAQFARLVEHSEAVRARRQYRTPRTWPYLVWRYGRLAELHRPTSSGEPYARYGVFALEEAGRLRAAAVLRPTLSGGLAGASLVELFLDPSDAALGHTVLTSLFDSLRADYVVAHFARGTVEYAALVATRFQRLPRQATTFAVRTLTPHGADPLDVDQWDLSLGDLEVF